MPAIHIRDVPEDVLAALKRRAAANNRSLQMELRHLLAQIARQAPPPEPLPPLKLHLCTAAPTQATWSRDEIYADDDGR